MPQSICSPIYHRVFPSLRHSLTAGITGSGPEEKFNLALHVNDNAQKVIENRRRLCRYLTIPFEAYTCAEQIHSSNLSLTTHNERGRGRIDQEDVLRATDALITNTPGIMLNIFVADCVPIILYDPLTNSGGICHAGWRGTAETIVLKTIRAMSRNFHAEPENIRAYIGPSIGPCCYFVGMNVQEAFYNNFTYKNDPFIRSEDKLKVDLKKANREQLITGGLKIPHIEISPDCTLCSEKKLFSYRKSGDAAGRFSAFFYLKHSS